MPRLPRALLLPALLSLTLAASSCTGAEAPPPTVAESPTEAGTQAGTQAGTGTDSPTDEASGAPSGKPRPSRGPRARRTLVPLEPQQLLARPAGSHLLARGRVPRLAEDLRWVRVSGATDSSEPVGACQKASLVDIGALSTVQRTVEAADGRTTATQVVGRFPDRMSVLRAHQVLLSWRADCAERLAHPRTEVGEVRSVDVRAGVGEAYSAAWGPRPADRGRVTGVGIVRKGRWLSLVEIATDAGRWPSDQDPTRRAVRRIARTFTA